MYPIKCYLCLTLSCFILPKAANRGLVMVAFYNKFLNCTEDNAYEPGFRSANVQLIVEHMEYIRDRIGAEHVGIGSDYDGMD